MRGNPNPSPATRFKPGQSGNPKGVRKGFGALVRERVDPNEIIDMCLEMLRSVDAKDADRITAGKLLLEYGWGKPLTTVAIDASIRTEARAGVDSIRPSLLTDKQLDDLERLLEAATGESAVIDVECEDSSDRP